MLKNGALNGTITVQMVSVELNELLYYLSCQGIVFYNIDYIDSLTARVTVDRHMLKLLRRSADKKGVSIEILRKSGLYWMLKSIKSRPIVVLSCMLILALTVYLPAFVLFVEVEGNGKISTSLILEKAEICGIDFGAARRDVRSEHIKNKLLSELPELQWAGVNTFGCRAVISVKEGGNQSVQQSGNCVSSIVAARDGVIESCTTTKGTQLCKAGQVVKKDEILISGYTDCGIKIRATQAEGEVFAQTYRNLTVVVPLNGFNKGESYRTETKFSLIIGKKRINFFKGSGIYDTTCVKMYKEVPLTLPGELKLPVTLVVEHWIFYDQSGVTVDREYALDAASSFAEAYIQGNMISGRILNSTMTTEQTENLLILHGNYLCSEMIGRIRYEGVNGIYGEDN